MLPFALTIFTGAFLLFQVQPLIGKYILPWFGGSPGVWTTCLLFFQALLLGGYAYAHFTSKWLKPRQQAVLHGVLLLAALLTLPITPSDSWKPQPGTEPTTRILLLLLTTLGLPYLVLAATGPLIQRWFSHVQPGRSPYRLYALSNAGSLLALVSYPFLVEPAFTRQQQVWSWSVGLGVFVLVCGFCAFRLWNSTPARPEAGDGEWAEPLSPAPRRMDQVLWMLLPMTASVLLLAVTNKLCQDVAVVPFLWILPLALYLLSFIICFDHARWYRRGIYGLLMVVAVAIVCHLLFEGHSAPLLLQVGGYSGALFVACMICHGELYRLKPATSHLTSFYLVISAGGALGGLLVAVVAPLVLSNFVELQIGFWLLCYLAGYICLRDESRSFALGSASGVLLAALLLPALDGDLLAEGWGSAPLIWWNGLLDGVGAHLKEVALVTLVLLLCFTDRRRGILPEWRPRMGGFVMFLSLGFGLLFLLQLSGGNRNVVTADRNFYGMLKVVRHSSDTPFFEYDTLVHGAITHGLQFTDPVMAKVPTTYYGTSSGVGRALTELWSPEGRRIGLVGLGTGSLASYGEESDYLRIYEINPEVTRLATEHFTYIPNSLAEIDIVMGDARLSMEHELATKQPQRFDLLALDAFSSDAIPVHLLTKEAFEIYLQHIQADGVIAVHISNRYLDLRPVVEDLAVHFGLGMATIEDDDPTNWWIYRTTWILLSRNQAFLDRPEIGDVRSAPSQKADSVELWTDDFASLFEILR